MTFAEVLKAASYSTLMVGKWHNGHGSGEKPVDRGFDRYWGLLSGCSNYFNPGLKRPGEPEPIHKAPNDMRHWGDDDRVMLPYTPEDANFYSTNAFTQHALDLLEQYGREDRPFLLYVAHAAPHFPMQAWPQDIARYQGRYMTGWDVLRKQRYQRLVNMGLIDEKWGISERDNICPDWEGVTDKERWDRKMAVYAAMVDRMDWGVGKVLDKIRELGKQDNTLVLFLSDNGGCGEHIDNTPDKEPGGVDTYTTVDAPWANASNTPFRKYKVFDHEGGISTPLIACWPNVIEPGTITHQIGHVIDFLPTFSELGEADYPSHYTGHDILPVEGKSLTSIFRGGERPGHDSLFWELNGCRAV
ncbi:TPA: arylsulfatase, partial [Candidatus Poribacteria bacterium]|nr:arylsulfatase [Candidatus Poribacteria bacterium]